MDRLLARLMTLLTALLALPAFAQATHITPSLVAERADPKPGATVMVAISMATAPGWHGYWRNGGEAGYAPRLKWTVPRGVTMGDPLYPVPQLLRIAGLTNYVFAGDHALLVPMTIDASVARGTRVPVTLDAEWLACTDQICVPETGRFQLAVGVGEGVGQSDPRFDGWRAALPVPLDRKAVYSREGGHTRIAVPLPAGVALSDIHFFPFEKQMIADGSDQNFARAANDPDRLVIDIAGVGKRDPAGVLKFGEGRGITIESLPGIVPASGAPVLKNDTSSTPSASIGIVAAILAAVVGGIILNVMPCVFPILSLKALSLAKAGAGEGAARRDALAYTAGAVAMTLALGAAILALRAGGSAIGWAFQLQDPRVILFLFILMVAIAANLAGWFELPAISVGGGSSGGFLTGALAAFVATPCTGPFMGAALGAALVLPPLAALAVFGGLGLGLALPFLLIGFVPALRSRLPRPGPWMVKFRHWLAVPMALTALGLAWLLWRQAGVTALIVALALATLVVAALLWAGRQQRRGKAGIGLAALGVVALTTVTAIALPTAIPAAAVATSAGEPFSAGRLAQLRQQGKPVFLYFTADWCLTCKVNERAAIDRDDVRDAFRRAGIVTMVGDWTRPDPAIGRFLAEHGRSGVPYYLFFPANGGAPVELPQILSPATLTALGSPQP